MLNTKRGKKAFTSLAFLLFFASIGLNFFQHQKIRKLSTEGHGKMPAMNQSKIAVTSNREGIRGISEAATFSGKEREPHRDQVDELEYQLDAAEEELDIALKQISDAAERESEIEKKSVRFRNISSFKAL